MTGGYLRVRTSDSAYSSIASEHARVVRAIIQSFAVSLMVMKLKSAIPVALSTLFLLLSLSSGPVKAWWPFSDDENVQEEAGSQKASGSDGSQVLDGLVPFEIKTAEQKFLEEAHQLLKISPLDKCQHKVRLTYP